MKCEVGLSEDGGTPNSSKFQIPSDDGNFLVIFPHWDLSHFCTIPSGWWLPGHRAFFQEWQAWRWTQRARPGRKKHQQTTKIQFQVHEIPEYKPPGFRLVIAGLSCWECRMFFVGSGAGRQSQLAWLGLTQKTGQLCWTNGLPNPDSDQVVRRMRGWDNGTMNIGVVQGTTLRRCPSFREEQTFGQDNWAVWDLCSDIVIIRIKNYNKHN